ncbi:UDP-N-acetylmuramate dehydrogenase [Pseudoalteromonas tunicata]|uniref:UDP-N-acetylmuramate dehydrogenase n=1 Tax=Pseudoalteromonas tunicata TaxID=314281 RepID=UPI00273D8103|nr:UDP-N-acetylmuramate dehydrogenase [Pseudoalteromonas tunicata]MDP4985585.1 UDP-N-acetylmuramate dehydrogenase [Pseudoalteromonas tunicata]
MLSLQSLHTFALPAHASTLIKIVDPMQLQHCDFTQPFVVLGGGSNTLFLADFSGVVLQIANLGIEINENDEAFNLHVSAGENWHQLVRFTLDNAMPGLENLALIPGLCGAAPVQNIGAYGVELKDFLQYVDGFNIETKQFERLSASECQLAYRDSIFKHALKDKFIITAIGLSLTKVWQPRCEYGPLKALSDASAEQIFEQVIKIRSSKLPDPTKIANAGSFFKNPIIEHTQLNALLPQFPELVYYPVDSETVKVAAGWLIEQCDLKGFRIAGIEVNPLQALVLLNHGQSTGQDVIAMINTIQTKVYRQFKIQLQHEVRLIGDSQELTIEVAPC